jgi:hypothetical protein
MRSLSLRCDQNDQFVAEPNHGLHFGVLDGDWPLESKINLLEAGFSGLFEIAELDILRDGLNAIALEAEAGDQGGLARALRRIALLSEVWECLQCEPDQAEAAAEVADFCLRAIEHLVRDQRTGSRSGDLGICDEILRQSDERWSDYLSPVDSTSAGQSVMDEPASFEEA